MRADSPSLAPEPMAKLPSWMQWLLLLTISLLFAGLLEIAALPAALLIGPMLAEGRMVLDNATDSFAQVAASQGVVTLNSSMGLQAFFHDKPVITLGRAFFNLSGLVHHAESQKGLNALFAAPETLSYDAALRAAFLTWLDREYYVRFDWPGGYIDDGAEHVA